LYVFGHLFFWSISKDYCTKLWKRMHGRRYIEGCCREMYSYSACFSEIRRFPHSPLLSQGDLVDHVVCKSRQRFDDEYGRKTRSGMYGEFPRIISRSSQWPLIRAFKAQCFCHLGPSTGAIMPFHRLFHTLLASAPNCTKTDTERHFLEPLLPYRVPDFGRYCLAYLGCVMADI
jgi:hypothetical protein